MAGRAGRVRGKTAIEGAGRVDNSKPIVDPASTICTHGAPLSEQPLRRGALTTDTVRLAASPVAAVNLTVNGLPLPDGITLARLNPALAAATGATASTSIHAAAWNDARLIKLMSTSPGGIRPCANDPSAAGRRQSQ
jgi:hypothetical protein